MQNGDALELQRSLTTSCTPLVIFDPQYRGVLDREALQCWKGKKPVETITEKPLPHVADLNEAVPKSEWEPGLDGKPKPPWQHQVIVYLIDPTSGGFFTYLNSTIGARIAVDQLRCSADFCKPDASRLLKDQRASVPIANPKRKSTANEVKGLEPRRKTRRHRREHWQDGRVRTAPHDIATAAQAIRAELLGSNTAVALGMHVKAYAPILELCRRLVVRGIDPATPLEAWRGPTLCLRVQNIGAAAALEVRPSGTGRPVFVRRKTVRAALEVGQN
jgi:hypothetical protein